MPLPSGHTVTANEFAIATNEDSFASIGGCSLSTTSASYVDITGASKSFTKIGSAAQSDLLVYVEVNGAVNVGSTVFAVGVNINSVDTDATQLFFNNATLSLPLPATWVRITGLAANTYTVKLRAKRPSGTGTLSVDANNTVSFLVKERLL